LVGRTKHSSKPFLSPYQQTFTRVQQQPAAATGRGGGSINDLLPTAIIMDLPSQ
jgi:hypothetical protein